MNPLTRLCSKLCGKGRNPFTGVATPCTDPKYGQCITSTANQNDETCACQAGYVGDACDQTVAPSAKGQSTTLYPCTGRGEIEVATGFCLCDEGFVGAACELDVTNRDCGTGQAYRDNAAAGVEIVDLTFSTVGNTAAVNVSRTHGRFDGVAYLMANPQAIEWVKTIPEYGVKNKDIAFYHWYMVGRNANPRLDIWLQGTDAHGRFDCQAYKAANPTEVSNNFGCQIDAEFAFIMKGYDRGADVWITPVNP
jgi:hypothetical protein